MATERIDIVVTETGSRTVKRNLDDMAGAAQKADGALEALKAELAASRNAQKALEAELQELVKRINELEQASNRAGGGHKKHENSVAALKKEIVADNRIVNFFANALNSLVPASSAAGEGIRLLAGAMLGGTALSMAVELAMTGFKFLGEALKENEERALHHVEVVAKQRESMIQLSEAVEQFLTGLQVQGRGLSWFSQQLQGIQSELRKTGNEATTELEKLQVLRDGWFNGSKIEESKRKFRELIDTTLDLQYKQLELSRQYIGTVLPKSLDAEQKALEKSVADTVSSMDGETAKSKAFAWVAKNQEEIGQRIDALKERAAELQGQLNPKDGTLVGGQFRPSIEQRNLQAQIAVMTAEMTALEARARSLNELSRPIAEAQGRQVSTEWVRQEEEAIRRVRREQATLGANEYEQINARAAAALEELETRQNKALEQMVGATEADKNKIRATAALEALEIDKKRMAEQAELTRKGGVLRDLRAEVSPMSTATAKLAEAEFQLNRAVSLGLVSEEEKVKILGQMNFKYRDALDPMAALQRQLTKETTLLELNTDARDVERKIMEAEKTLRQQGIQLTSAETDALRQQYQALNDLNQVAQRRDQMYKDIRGPQQEMNFGQQALNQLYQQGTITLAEYNREMANLRLNTGNGTWTDGYLKNLGQLDKATQKFAARSGQAFADMTNTLVDGLANATARAIVFGEDWKEAVGNIAREAVASLIAALIKMGIQMVMNTVLGESLGAAATAASAAMATSTAVAWAPAAAYASLASYGANAAPAMTGIMNTLALTESFAAAGGAGFESGGYTGDFGRKEPVGIVHGQEFVANAAATRRNRATLEAMNAGATVGTGSVNITIENHSRASFETQQVSPTEIRIIAREEARKAVRDDSDAVVASHLSNPNSRVSRSLGRNTDTQRKRI